MKLLTKGDERALKVVRTSRLRPDTEYRLSGFVFSLEKDGYRLMKHTLTRQILALDAGEARALDARDLTNPLVQQLAKLRYLVEPEYDEAEQYELAVSVLRTMSGSAPGIGTYTILPTTACNARCVYCYEEGWRSETMTAETADRVAEYIRRTHMEKKIRLSWFGGEPLCSPRIISRICRGLTDSGVSYDSSIITNGTLLTPELAREASELWKLKNAQVSMDGARGDYEARKCYLRPETDNFDAAMRAVELLADAGVNVVLRCNYDAENLPRMREFFAECRERFGGRKNVSLYLEQLFQSSTAEENAELYRAAAEQERLLSSLGMATRARLSSRLKTAYCLADSGRSVVIDPRGGLHLCDNKIDGEPFGTIYDEPAAPPPRSSAPLAEKCRKCCFLPDCTAFRKNGCPVTPAACRTQMELRTVRQLETLYERAGQAQEPETTEQEEKDC